MTKGAEKGTERLYRETERPPFRGPFKGAYGAFYVFAIKDGVLEAWRADDPREKWVVIDTEHAPAAQYHPDVFYVEQRSGAIVEVTYYDPEGDYRYAHFNLLTDTWITEGGTRDIEGDDFDAYTEMHGA